jgi:hypothetical protein
VAFTHDGHRVTADLGSPTRAAYRDRQGAERDVARFAAGSTVRVYVNPADPTGSFLKRPEAHVIAFEAVGALALLGAASVCVLSDLAPGDEVRLFFVGLGAALCVAVVAAAVALFQKS